MKNILVSFTMLFVASCASTPSIEIKHKPLSHTKRVEPAPVNLKNSNRAQEAKSLTPSFVASSSPTVQDQALPKTQTSSSTAVVELTNSSLQIKGDELLPISKKHSTQSFSTQSKKIGVILPITGKNSLIAQRALSSIRLGLGLLEKDPSFSIVIHDSQGSPELAAAGVEKLLQDQGVIALLGGISAKEAQAIATQADFFQVPFMAFSQKSGLTNNNDYTFRNSITSEMQIERLVRFASKNLNAKRYAILYPNDSYGVEFANKFWDLVLASGGQVTAAQVYDPKDTDFNVYIQKLVGTYFTEPRLDEYRQRQKELVLKNSKKKEAGYKKNIRENEAKENILLPVIDFDVLFIPDSSKALGQAIAFMGNNDVTNITYLGTNLWQSSDLSRRVGQTESSVFFVDSFIDENLINSSEFYKNYKQQFNEAPSLLEAQFYEGAYLIKDTISSGYTSRDSLASQLKILGRRKGAYGQIRMNNYQEIERPLNIFSLEQGAIKIIE